MSNAWRFQRFTDLFGRPIAEAEALSDMYRLMEERNSSPSSLNNLEKNKINLKIFAEDYQQCKTKKIS